MDATLTAEEITRLLEEPSDDRWVVMNRIIADAPIRGVISALQMSSVPFTRQLLCTILGFRRARSAVPELLIALRDPYEDVRFVAADAIAKTEKISTGPELLEALHREETEPVRSMLILALGGVGYRPAIGELIQYLADSSEEIRASAARALNVLQAREAIRAIRLALARETEDHAIHWMQDALDALGDSPLS